MGILIGALLCCMALGFVVYMLAEHPRTLFCALVFLLLVASCYRADASPPRYELSVLIDSADDRAAADEAVRQATAIYAAQLGVELAVVSVDVAEVAQHSQAFALLDGLKVYRFAQGYDRTSDATVLLTSRELTRGYQGIATAGPPCSASASVVVSLKADGLDGQILAHELAHTLGVSHDPGAGWLMSDSPSRTGADAFSPDSIATVKAASLDCMLAVALPPPQTGMVGEAAPSNVPAGTSGGGGAFDWLTWLVLGCFVLLAYIARRYEVTERRLRARIIELEALQAPIFGTLDISSFESTDTESPFCRSITIEFTSLSGMVEFGHWLIEARRLLKRNGWPVFKP